MKHNSRRAFSAIDLVVSLAVISLLAMQVAPALQTVREEARRTACGAKMNEIALGLLVYETTMGSFPKSSSRPVYSAAPGNPTDGPGASDAGYSWVAKILPAIEQSPLDKAVQKTSQRYKVPAFDPRIKFPAEGDTANARHVSTQYLEKLVCPAFTGNAAVSGAAEYKAWAGVDAATKKPFGVALSNYVAMSATHVECMQDPQKIDPKVAEPPNGVISPQGTKLKDILDRDGAHVTILICETREPNYASWYDGTTAWAVAFRPKDPGATPPYLATVSRDPKTKYWIGGDAGQSSLNVGPKPDAKVAYLKADQWKAVCPNAGAADWQWGPSSEHVGVVMHAFCDRSVKALNVNIDKDVYMHLVTFRGREFDQFGPRQ